MRSKIILLTALVAVLITEIGFFAYVLFPPIIISVKNTFPGEPRFPPVSIIRRFSYNVTVFNLGHARSVTVFGELPVQADGNWKNITEQELIHFQFGETKIIHFTFNFPTFSYTISASISSARFWIES